MNIQADAINYFSLDGLPWLLASWFFIYLFRPISTIFHEIGHFVPACFLSKNSVAIEIGKGRTKLLFLKRGRFEISFSLVKPSLGLVSYEDQDLGKWSKILILLGGPFLSLSSSCLLFWLLMHSEFVLWFEVMLIGLLCSNLLCLFKSAFPMRLKPTKDFPEGPPSDGLQIIWELCSKNDQDR